MEHVTISAWYFQLHSMQIFNSRRIAKQFSKTLCTHCDFIHKVFLVACIDNFFLKNSVLIHMTMSSLLWLTIFFMEVNRSKTGFFKSYSALLVTSYCALCTGGGGWDDMHMVVASSLSQVHKPQTGLWLWAGEHWRFKWQFVFNPGSSCWFQTCMLANYTFSLTSQISLAAKHTYVPDEAVVKICQQRLAHKASAVR